MSAEATGWVYRHSPYTGATYQVHQAIADSANDQHENRFWMRQRKLARKARVSRASVQRALDLLVADGFLERLGIATGTDDLVEYRFLQPEVAVHYDPSAPGGVPRGEAGGSRGDADAASPRGRGVPQGEAVEEPKGGTQDGAQHTAGGGALFGDDEAPPIPPPGFDDFWSAYPRKVGKAAAERAWTKATKRADPAAIVAGAERYAVERAAVERRKGKPHAVQFTAHPSTWLNDGRWDDEAEAPDRGRDRGVDTNRARATGALSDDEV